MTIGERIRMYREKADLTQAELASRIGTTPQNIYKYEQGIITNIPLKSIQAIADVFLIPPSLLAGWDDYDEQPTNAFNELCTRFSYMNPKTAEAFIKYCLSLTSNDISNLLRLTDEELALIKAYRAAPAHLRAIVDTALSPYLEEAGSSISRAE